MALPLEVLLLGSLLVNAFEHEVGVGVVMASCVDLGVPALGQEANVGELLLQLDSREITTPDLVEARAFLHGW